MTQPLASFVPPQVSEGPAFTPAPKPYDPTQPVSPQNPFNYNDLLAYKAKQAQQAQSQTVPGAGLFTNETGEGVGETAMPPMPAAQAPPAVSPPFPPAAAQAPVARAGTPEMQATAPAAGMSFPVGIPGIGQPAHKVGLSPADTAMWIREQGRTNDALNRLAEAGVINRDAVDTFKQQADQYEGESDMARLAYEHNMRTNDAQRAAIEHDDTERRTKIDGKLAELEGQGINPNRWWQSQSTAGKIAGAIAIGLGEFAAHGLGAHPQTHENTALNMINSAIASDVDAQKMDLQKKFELAKTRMDLGERGFNHQLAMLNAEKDSIQTGYAIARGTIAQKVALAGSTQAAQQWQADTNLKLDASRDALLKDRNHEIYALQKGSEKVVGGAGDANLEKEIRIRAQKIADDAAAAGKPVDVAQARRRAVYEFTGHDPVPQAGPLIDYSKEPKGGANGALSPRLVKSVAELEAQNENIRKLKTLLGNGPESANRFTDIHQGGAARTYIQELRRAHPELPENPLGWFENQGKTAAQLDALEQENNHKINAMKNGGNAPEEPTAESEGLSEDK